MEIQFRNDSVLIEGYVNAVARDSNPIFDQKTGRYFIEQISPGAFRKALERNKVLLLLNHKKERVLGSTESNLTLIEDNIGLKARAVITDEEIIRTARKQRLRGWSFGFVPWSTRTETRADGTECRVVEDMQLIEVSLIDRMSTPCYDGTSVEVRSSDDLLGVYKNRLRDLGSKI